MFRKANKFLHVFISIFCFFFLLFFGWKGVVNTFFYLGQSSKLEWTGKYQGEIAYEKMLDSSGSGNISTLMKEIIIGKEAERMELIGDALYIRSAPKKEVLSWYERSLVLDDNARIREKVTLISAYYTPSPVSSGSLENHGTGSQNTGSIDSSRQYDDILSRSRDRIEEDQKNRGKYMEKSGEKYILQDSIDFLDLGIERVDW